MSKNHSRDLHYVFAHNWAAAYATFEQASIVASKMKPCVVVSWKYEGPEPSKYIIPSPVASTHGYKQIRKVEYK